jgi:hypothetical protein
VGYDCGLLRAIAAKGTVTVRRRKQPAVRLSAPDDRVFALSDIGGTQGFVSKGSPLDRDHPHVRNRPDLFEVRYPLHLERREEVDDGE